MRRTWSEGGRCDLRPLVVSHETVFLDEAVTRIVELYGDTGRAVESAGNYSSYVCAKIKTEAALVAAFNDQQPIRVDSPVGSALVLR